MPKKKQKTEKDLRGITSKFEAKFVDLWFEYLNETGLGITRVAFNPQVSWALLDSIAEVHIGTIIVDAIKPDREWDITFSDGIEVQRRRLNY